MLLETEALSRSFGGIEAVSGVELRLPPGQIRALIGPNGAGKTTLVSIICGRLRPTSGRIIFKGHEITGLADWQRAQAGIVYTFQVTSVFQNLSCHDNVALAVQRRSMRGLGGRLHLDARLLRQRVEAALARVGLAAAGSRLAATLPYGHQRLLEVAMGLALEPELLIMDEPTQGLSEAEIGDFCGLIREVATDLTVLLVEHNMPVVMTLADRITVLESGRILAEGSPEEIRGNSQVQRAYLGLSC